MKIYLILCDEDYVGRGFFIGAYYDESAAEAACKKMNEARIRNTSHYYVKEKEVSE